MTIYNKFKAARRALQDEASRMEAGEPHAYAAAYRRFCAVQRKINKINIDSNN